MRPPRLALLAAALGLALFSTPVLPAQEKLPAPMPTGVGGAVPCDGGTAPCCSPCQPACPAPPKVVVEMSQPEIHFAAPCRSGGGCQKGGGGCPPRSKASFVNINISRVKSRIQGGLPGGGGALQPVTTVVPAYATATIPIAFQTTQYAAYGAQAGLLGTGVAGRQASELSRADIQDMVREAFQREAAERQAAQRQASPLDGCAELKGRVDKIENRLTDLENQVKGILKKLTALP